MARFPDRVVAAGTTGHSGRSDDRLCDLDGRVHPHLPGDRLAADAAALHLRVAADPGDARAERYLGIDARRLVRAPDHRGADRHREGEATRARGGGLEDPARWGDIDLNTHAD